MLVFMSFLKLQIFSFVRINPKQKCPFKKKVTLKSVRSLSCCKSDLPFMICWLNTYIKGSNTRFKGCDYILTTALGNKSYLCRWPNKTWTPSNKLKVMFLKMWKKLRHNSGNGHVLFFHALFCREIGDLNFIYIS